MGGCMLIVLGRGQGVVLDETERHLAGECWQDEWAVILVSACCPFLSAYLWFSAFLH